jgi:hypothetical protein
MSTLRLPEADRKAVIEKSKKVVQKILNVRDPLVRLKGVADGSGPPERNCILWAATISSILNAEYNLPAMFQAGSAGWQRLRPEQDDGKPTTFPHFSYVWTPERAGYTILKGNLPEMHAWVVIKADNGNIDDSEFIDPTTGKQPENCRLLTGMDWPGDKPPDYLWCLGKNLKKYDYVYKANQDATQCAAHFVEAMLEDTMRLNQIIRRPQGVAAPTER